MLTLTLSLLTLSPLALLQDPPAPPHAEVLVLGTYHMNSPGQDMINPATDDVLGDVRQAEIEDLVARIARFEPTHIAVEELPSGQERLDAWYRRFLEGGTSPSRSEVYQVAFPLAAEMQLEGLHAIDHEQGLAMQSVLDFAEQHQPEIAALFASEIERMRDFFDRLMVRPIPEILTTMNTPDPKMDHGFYMLMAQVGTAAKPIGADVSADWHSRNLKIYGNIARLAKTGKERIVVLIGAGHAPLLRTFVQGSPNLRLANTLDYLKPQ